MDPDLSVVLPAYNEEGNIERAVRSTFDAVSPLVERLEVVVVDDGSSDATPTVLAGLAGTYGERLRVLRLDQNLGYGAALRAGFQAARGRLIFYTDSDNQFDLSELAGFLPLMAEWDAVLGFRIDRKDPIPRKVASAVFNTLTCVVLGVWVRDLNCSFKLFRKEALQGLPLEANDFFIDSEMVVRFVRAGFRHTQRGVQHFPRTVGQSTVRLSDIPRTLRAIFRMRLGLPLASPA